MKRRTSMSSSSLELFLDTICNAFGGIVFIAILVSLMVQLRSKDVTAEMTQSTNVTLDLATLSNELMVLSSERAKLASLIEELNVYENNLDIDSLNNVKQQVALRQKVLEEIRNEHSAVVQKLAKQLEANLKAQGDLINLERTLEAARQMANNLDKQLLSELDERQQSLDIPEVRATSKANVLILMRYGKIYQVQNSSSAGITRSFNQEHIETRKNGSAVRPRQNAGWSLDNPVDKTEWEKLLSDYSPTDYFITIGVWGDSFEQFREVKESLITAGFDYELAPLGGIDEVTIGSSPNSPRVQ